VASTRGVGDKNKGWGLTGVDTEVAQTSLVDGVRTTGRLEPAIEESSDGEVQRWRRMCAIVARKGKTDVAQQCVGEPVVQVGARVGRHSTAAECRWGYGRWAQNGYMMWVDAGWVRKTLR
jgi:hypothetical protein